MARLRRKRKKKKSEDFYIKIEKSRRMFERAKKTWEKYFEPDRVKHPPLCQESRQMFKDCVVKSECFRRTEQFKPCAQEEINAECIPLRVDYFRCKHYMVDRSKDFRRDPRHS